jgi:hypothetical protein
MLSAEEAVAEALLAALAQVAGLNGAFPGPPTHATAPWAELGEMTATDWSAVGVTGRELRVTVRLVDRLDTPARLHGLTGTAEAAIAALPRDLADWRLASVTLTRTRILRDKPSGWAAVVEYRLRLSAI